MRAVHCSSLGGVGGRSIGGVGGRSKPGGADLALASATNSLKPLDLNAALADAPSSASSRVPSATFCASALRLAPSLFPALTRSLGPTGSLSDIHLKMNGVGI